MTFVYSMLKAHYNALYILKNTAVFKGT